MATPVASFVGVGQGFSLHDFLAQSHVIEFLLLGSESNFDVAQTFSRGQLRKGHGVELIVARESFDASISVVALDASVESSDW